MMGITARKPTENGLCQKRLAPECDETARIQVTGM